MKLINIFLMTVVAIALQAATPAWVKQDKNFLLKFEQGYFSVNDNGDFSLCATGQPPTRIALFLWHDAWVYETLARGKVESAVLLPEGQLQFKGLWGMSQASAELRYTLTFIPEVDQVAMALEVEKSAPLELSQGIWASMKTAVSAEDNRTVYLYPGGDVPVGKNIEGLFKNTYIGVEDGRSVFFSGEGLCSLRSSQGGGNHSFEVKIGKKKDFAVGDKMIVRMMFGFADMPAIIRPEVVCNAPLTLSAQAPRELLLYSKCELEADLTGVWENPYDPDQITLDAEVTTATGKTYTHPGFFMVPHLSEQEGVEDMQLPCGRGVWKVRLAATEVGPLSVTLKARDASGEVVYQLPHRIMVKADQQAKGFVRVSEKDAHYMAHDNGEGFVPIGHNVPIYQSSNAMSVKDILEKMAAQGENWNRWWMSRSGLGIEWESRLGWYRQAQSAKLDALLDDAGRLGMYYMLCMDTHQDFREGGWKVNPFNVEQGGPCQTAGEWFTNEQARQFYRKRLRYTVARWGYSPHVLCWEFGNEFEGWADAKQETIIEWHREMAPVLAALDPYDHLITTSWWSKTGPASCWQIPEIGIVQTHSYANNDLNVALEARDYCLTQWNGFQKPHLFAEFGIRSHNFSAEDDPTGRAIHNTLWAAIASGCAGAPMPWWHENYIEPKGLYFHFQSIRSFITGLPFGTERWQQVSVTSPAAVMQPARASQRDIVVPTRSGFRKPVTNEFSVAENGDVSNAGELLALLHGAGHRDLVNPPVFEVNYPQDGDFIIHVDRVSNSGLLKIYIDDELAMEKTLACGENRGKSWKYVAQWKLWESTYDADIALPVKAGIRRIRVENHGADWVAVKSYTFTGCRTKEEQSVICCALASASAAVLWIQNSDSTWLNHASDASQIRTFPPAEYILEGFADGSCEVEWWETWTGSVLRRERVQALNGQLRLNPGPLATDVAARIRY